MSEIVAALPIRKEKTAPFRWPLLLLGIALIVVYAADTVAASMATYLPFDVPVERFIQSINWGPLGQVFMALDWTEGTRQQILGIAGIAVLAAVNWRAVTLVVLAARSGARCTDAACGEVTCSHCRTSASACPMQGWQKREAVGSGK